MSSFAPLHVHSHYSLLKALPKVPALIAKAQSVGVKALALTDINNLYGAIEFYIKCKEEGIKPIIGLDVAIPDGKRLVLLAENNEGYQNLMALVTKTHEVEASGAPLLPALLSEHKAGLIAIEPAQGSYDDYQALFAPGQYFAFGEVALPEVYYLEPGDRRAWETMCAIEHRGARDSGGIEDGDDEFYFPAEAEMERRFSKEQLDATLAIAERCNVELTIGTFIFPEFPLPKGKTNDDLLRELCLAGIKARGLEGRADVLERLDYELGIIKFKGYAAYFLVVEDLIRFARERNIYTNIRGSVAGSMTTYLLQITKIDPLEYQIPFERFLNPERPSAPDVDMDFADDRRDEVIEYARKRYGEDKVAQIGTFGTMLARGVVRDVARALGLPYGLGDAIAKQIPVGSQGFPMTLERALAESPDLAAMYKKDPQVKEVIDLGKVIEGCARHISVHAAGVVISPRPLIEYTPLQRDPKGGKIITQYDMYSVGEDGVGLTKFDFLGIRNLTILASAVELVKKTTGQDIDIEAIPLDDQKTYEMLTRGETEATFQLNGQGMTRFLKELKPSSIHDINAMVALYRPGPMQFIPQYIERKHKPSLIRYMDPAMEPILKQTYGILVYQDDLLIMANVLAGYTWGEVDKFRKAVGKKIPEEMAAQKEKFIDGCVKHSGWDRKKAERVWEWIEPFAAYGFNKAHSASYGRVAYQTAYMKANFPTQYMTAVLTAEAGNIDTVAIMVNECKRMGIMILPPDVNESFSDFTAILDGGPEGKGAIRFGLSSIKNFGEGVGAAIIEERKNGGRFSTLSDFLRRVTDKNLNKKSLESLIQCGALDSLAPAGGRGQMLAHIERMLEYHKEHAGANAAQDSLFSLMSDTGVAELVLPKADDVLNETKLAWEKELLGLYVSGHPLDKYREKLASRSTNIEHTKQTLKPGMQCVVQGLIEVQKTILTKGGDQMSFLTIADLSGKIEVVIFPKLLAAHKDLLVADAVIAVKGRLSERNGERSIVAEAVKAL